MSTSPLFDLKGKVALVTGGNTGLGRAMALALRDAGALVAIAGRRAEMNAAVAAELGENHLSVEMDVLHEESVALAVAQVAERMGRLDILVNNAGTVKRASVLEHERADWDRVMAVNVTGPFLCTKHAARVMVEQKSGKIINISSVYGIIAPSRGLQVSYTVSKHALLGLTRVNAVELAPHGIQVNAVLPGWHETEMNADARSEEFTEAVALRTPSGRWGSSADVAGTCVYLASRASDNVTGAFIVVDGGYSASDGLDRG
jgi:2-dehydro-3-deoxy-D-gluconate 5-dehydrogenase